MKAVMILGVAGFCLLATASDAWAQCRGGGGGSAQGATAAGSASGSSSGTLLTSPGSWAYDVMAAQQMQQARLQQQQAIAAREAQEDAARKAARIATHTQRRLSEQYRRQRFRELLASSAN